MPTALFVALLKGIAVGVLIALPVGPVGVLCLRRTIFQGPSYGFLSGLGAATADTVFGIIAGFGLTFVRDLMLRYQDWLALAGGAFLLFIGIKALIRAREAEPEPVDRTGRLAAYASTFALTITNPVTILAFAGIFAELGIAGGAGLFEVGLLIAGVFLGSLLWWLGLSFGIAGLHRSAAGRRLLWLNRISGAILSLSGLALTGTAFAELIVRG